MEIKNKIKNLDSKEKNTDSQKNKNLPSSDDFQKEIDKKIKEENSNKKQEKKEEKIDRINDEKAKTDTKDLSTLKLFVLPYVNKDILSINLKDYIEPQKNINNKQNNFNLNLERTPEFYNYEAIKNNKEEKKQKNTTNFVEFNPFSTFEKLQNSLKDISKEEKVSQSKIIKELIEKLDIQKLQDSRMVEIKFNKENLGGLKVQILNENNKVSVMFKTDSKFLYDQLKNNTELLKEMLENRNLKAEKIIIDYEEVD